MLGIVLDRTQQGPGWARWAAAALFPVPEGADIDIKRLGKLGLGQPGGAAYGLDVVAIVNDLARRLTISSQHLIHLLRAGKKLIEEFIVHVTYPASYRRLPSRSFFAGASDRRLHFSRKPSASSIDLLWCGSSRLPGLHRACLVHSTEGGSCAVRRFQ